MKNLGLVSMILILYVIMALMNSCYIRKASQPSVMQYPYKDKIVFVKLKDDKTTKIPIYVKIHKRNAKNFKYHSYVQNDSVIYALTTYSGTELKHKSDTILFKFALNDIQSIKVKRSSVALTIGVGTIGTVSLIAILMTYFYLTLDFTIE